MKRLLPYLLLISLLFGKAYAQCTSQVIASYFPSVVCAGKTLNLSASTVAGATYSWAGPAGFFSTGQNPTIAAVSVSGLGSYIVTATAGVCVYRDTVNVTVNPRPLTPMFSILAPTCKGNTFSFNLVSSSIPGITFTTWNPAGTVVTSPIPNLTAANNGTYKAIATSSIGCVSDTGTYNLQITDLPAPTLNAISPHNCKGDSMTFFVTNNTPFVDNYYWMTPGGTFMTSPVPLVVPNIMLPGNYSVQTAYNSCFSPVTTIGISFNPEVFATTTVTMDGEIFPGYTTITFTADVVDGGPNPTFQWYRNGSPVPSATQQTYTGILFQDINPLDMFYVEVKRDTICGGTASSNVVILNEILDVQDLQAGRAISVYPNPSNGTFTVSLLPAINERTDNTLEVVSAVGAVVYKESIQPGITKHTVTLPENISNGIYLLRVNSGEHTYVQRVTVNR